MPHRILLIEDSDSDVFLIREAIDSAQIGAEVHVVADGQAATQFIDDVDRSRDMHAADLVVLDLNLPKRNGDEVLKHLRASPRFRDAIVLIVSSSDAPRDRHAVSELSVAGYFRKPSGYFEYMKLGPMIKALLEGRSGKVHPAASSTST